MALCPGIVSVTIEFAEGLKEHDFIFRQSPYCTLSVGAQTYRTQVASKGGRNPVWNETFQFNICNENDLVIEVKRTSLGTPGTPGTPYGSLHRAPDGWGSSFFPSLSAIFLIFGGGWYS
ncbi:hypothetical protein Vafri_466 [Volvox africanus]|nr:hypothetical protein Vafri_466 [Volvox africanus]